MELALFVPGFPRHEDEWFVPCMTGLVEDLGRRHGIRVYATKYPEERAHFEWKGISVASFGKRRRKTVGPLRIGQAVSTARKDHGTRRFDCVVALWGDESVFAAALCSRLERIPLVFKISGGEVASIPKRQYGTFRSPWQRFCLGTGLRRAAVFGVESIWKRSQVLSAGLPLRAEPVLLPYGIDTGHFSCAPESVAGDGSGRAPTGHRADDGSDDGTVRLLSVGSLTPVKGYDLMLRVVARVVRRHPSLTLRIVGDGPQRGHLERLADSLGIAGCLTWDGWVEHDRLPAVYRGSDLFVSASFHEGQGLACMEAMACGLPVVGSAVGTLPELRQGWGAGVLFTPGDEQGLERALDTVLSGRQHWKAMGERSRLAIEERYTREQSLRRWEDALEQAL